MDKNPDQGEDNPRLFSPLRAFGYTAGAFVLAFGLLILSSSTDAVTLSSRVAVLLLPVALGLVPVLPAGGFVRRKTWRTKPVLRVFLGLYVCVLLAAGGLLNQRGFGIMGPPVAPPSADLPPLP